MYSYRYQKAYPKTSYKVAAVSLLSLHKSKALSLASYAFIATGLILITNALYPIISYELLIAPKIARVEIPKHLVQPPASKNNNEVLAREDLDLTQAQNWFPGATPVSSSSTTNIEFYNISIPRLNISDAIVNIGGTDLNKSLIHYKGTASPGQPGNSVIFGHSVLPQFFNPKNYVSIFSTLHTLELGDKVFVDFDGIEYRFEITEFKEVKPTDLSVLEQRYDQRELTLVTCTPPGTYLRRLVVRAKLIDNPRS